MSLLYKDGHVSDSDRFYLYFSLSLTNGQSIGWGEKTRQLKIDFLSLNMRLYPSPNLTQRCG